MYIEVMWLHAICSLGKPSMSDLCCFWTATNSLPLHGGSLKVKFQEGQARCFACCGNMLFVHVSPHSTSVIWKIQGIHGCSSHSWFIRYISFITTKTWVWTMSIDLPDLICKLPISMFIYTFERCKFVVCIIIVIRTYFIASVYHCSDKNHPSKVPDV